MKGPAFASFVMCSFVIMTPLLSHNLPLLIFHTFFCLFWALQWLVFSNRCVLSKLETHFRKVPLDQSAFNTTRTTGLSSSEVWYALLTCMVLGNYKTFYLLSKQMKLA
jgi:hypothetical protein